MCLPHNKICNTATFNANLPARKAQAGSRFDQNMPLKEDISVDQVFTGYVTIKRSKLCLNYNYDG